MKPKFLAAVTLLTLALLGVFIQLPQAAADGAALWFAQFYNNSFQTEPAVLTRQDNLISFNWGAGSPAPGVAADNFSARWSADPYFTAGTYRFSALADDGVRVWVDYQPIIDAFLQPRVGQTLVADVALGTGFHHIQVDYREAAGDAYVYVLWNNLAVTLPTPTPTILPPPVVIPGVSSGPWVAQYFSNPTLSGFPGLIQTESTPSHFWGPTAPVASLPADYWSARWTSTLTFEAGTYQINVRSDDGVRVYVNGIPVINEFHVASPQTFSATVNFVAGSHNFVIEFYDETLDAFLDFNIVKATGGTVTTPPVVVPPAPTNATMTVGQYRVNVRNVPQTLGSSIVAKINPGETYPVVGRNADSSWWQINVNGAVGWVYGGLVQINNRQNVPVTSGSAPTQVQSTGYTVSAIQDLNIRGGPSTSTAILGTLPGGAAANIVARNATNTWWRINYNGIVGWVSSAFARIQRDADLGSDSRPVIIGHSGMAMP